jgi:hypothetical protein
VWNQAVLLGFAITWAMACSFPAFSQSAWPNYPNNKTISVSSDGHVGIGTYPNRTLHINARNGAVAIQDSNAGGHEYVFTNVGPGDGTMGLYDETLSAFRWTVTPGGNFGIGMTSPATSLHVAGVAPYTTPLGSASNPSLRIGNKNASSFGEKAELQFAVGGNSIPTAAVSALYSDWASPGGQLVGSDLLFSTKPASGSLTERMRVTAAGNVGIGTSVPQYKLAVNGTIGAKEVIVTNTGWADYVFSPTYRLAPLAEVADFIAKNHHLPEIPTEAEAALGVGVGEMQAKLLAKIEELTLHMIQAEERSNRLERQNEEIREQNRLIRQRFEHVEERATARNE